MRLVMAITLVLSTFACSKEKKQKPLAYKPCLPKPGYVKCFPLEGKIDALLQRHAKTYKIDWKFAKAVLIKESHFHRYLVSVSGAVGLMQLMPRYGSYVTDNYRNYTAGRKVKRNSKGQRKYKEKDYRYWARQYQKDLQTLVKEIKDKKELAKKDTRFDMNFNIRSGIGQLAGDYYFFKKRGHSLYVATVLTAAAFNAGRGASSYNQPKAKYDHIPINGQTEYYTAFVMRIYEALKRGGGRLLKRDRYILYL